MNGLAGGGHLPGHLVHLPPGMAHLGRQPIGEPGETLAMQRAYRQTGVDPATVGLVEAHGTGIPLGDRTEIASLKSTFGERRAPVATKASL